MLERFVLRSHPFLCYKWILFSTCGDIMALVRLGKQGALIFSAVFLNARHDLLRSIRAVVVVLEERPSSSFLQTNDTCLNMDTLESAWLCSKKKRPAQISVTIDYLWFELLAFLCKGNCTFLINWYVITVRCSLPVHDDGVGPVFVLSVSSIRLHGMWDWLCVYVRVTCR